MKIINAFSANMLVGFPSNVQFEELTALQARELVLDVDQYVPVQSAVGHADTAAVFSSVLDLHIDCNRVTVTLQKGDTALLGQYSGPRLEEGATSLPEGATIRWLYVQVM